MNKTVLGIGATCAGIILFAASSVHQQAEISALKAKIVDREKEVATQTQELRKIQKQAESLAEQKIWLAQESEALHKKVDVLKAETAATAAQSAPDDKALAAPEPSKKLGGMRGMLAEMMKDPAMKNAVRMQQKIVLEGQMAGLIKELGLTPEKGRELIDLLVEKQMGAMEAMHEGKGDIEALNKENDAQIKALLGSDAKYAQYQEYQKSIPSRMMMDQLKQQMATTQSPLQDFQTQPLLKIMQEESSRPNPGLKSMQDLKPSDFGNPESVNQMIAYQQDLNRRVLARAPAFLDAAQVKALEAFQKNQLELQKAGLVMAQKMMKNESGGTGGK